MMKLNPLCIMLLLALLCAFFSYNANAQSAGVITSISGTSLTNVANKIIPIAIQKVKEVPIEDMSEGHFSVSGISITHLDIEGFSVGTNGNSIVVNLDRLAVNVHINRWRYHTKLFSTHGHASCRGALGAYLEPRLVSLGNRFGLQMGTVNANVQDFHISIGGGVVAKIINGLKSLFNSKIRAAVRNAVEPAIKNAILTMAQNISNQIPTSASFAGDSTFSLVPAAFGVRYDGNAVSVAFNGAINGVEVQRHGIENLFAPSGALFDVMLDTFVFNSALSSRTWRTLIYDINRPGNLPVPGWYGRDYAYVLPALAAKYPNEAISYQLSFATVPVVTSTQGYVGAQVVGYYKIFAGTTNVAVIQANLSAAVSAGIEGRADGKYYITAQIAKPALSFQTNSSEIGNIDFGLMNAILDIASQLLTAVANEVLSAGFQIPSVTGMSLSNPRFTAPEGAIRFGTDVDFNIPV